MTVRNLPTSLDDPGFRCKNTTPIKIVGAPDPTAKLPLHKNEGSAGVVQNGLAEPILSFCRMGLKLQTVYILVLTSLHHLVYLNNGSNIIKP